MKKIIFSSNAPKPIGPYSQAVECNGMVFVSGQIALDENANLLTDDIVIETQIVMKNIEHILTQAGAGFDSVVKCTIFLKNMDDFQHVNDVYGSFFQTDPPARETVQVSRLPKDVNVEISCIAMVRQ